MTFIIVGQATLYFPPRNKTRPVGNIPVDTETSLAFYPQGLFVELLESQIDEIGQLTLPLYPFHRLPELLLVKDSQEYG